MDIKNSCLYNTKDKYVEMESLAPFKGSHETALLLLHPAVQSLEDNLSHQLHLFAQRAVPGIDRLVNYRRLI